MKKSYLISSLIISFSISVLIWLFFHLISIREQNTKAVLEIEEARAERLIEDIFNQTASIISAMNSQIKEKPYDKKYINNILTKYKTSPDLIDTFSWTIFSWTDIENKIVVDAVYEIMKEPIDLSSRDYIPLTRKNPGTFYLGTPVIGSTSAKWMIPGGVGIVDKDGKYLGTMTIGFEIDALAKIIQKNIKNKNINITMIGSQDSLPILNSSANMFESFKNQKKTLDKKTRILLEQLKNFSDTAIADVSILKDRHGYLAKKIGNYDFAIVLEYDKKAITNELWTSIFSRLIEIIIVLIMSGLIIFLIYKRERNRQKVILLLKDQAEKATQSKSSLLKTLSHDLKNYVYGIGGMLEMILESKTKNNLKPEDEINYLNLTSKSSKEMGYFLEDLLDAEQAESGVLKLTKIEDCDLKEIIERVILFNKSQLLSSRIQIKTSFDENLPKIKFDQKRLKQILMNLIGNAIKYSNQNTIVEVNCFYLKDKNEVKVVIKDQGIGMTAEEIKMALNGKGTEIEKTGLNKDFNSNGIGLPTVVQLIEAGNGKINITSKKNEGSVIELAFRV